MTSAELELTTRRHHGAPLVREGGDPAVVSCRLRQDLPAFAASALVARIGRGQPEVLPCILAIIEH
ncbi:MAG TPA: hypothetical protein VFP34_05945 [Microlunatus sp.]|nr:hypothetical protein [Microlunatus sp.]